MNQGKKDVVKKEMARVNMDILGIGELTWTGIKENEVKVLVTQSCLTFCDPMDYSPPGSSVHGKNTGVGSHALLPGIFPTWGSHPSLLHWQENSFLSESPGKLWR